MRRAITFGESVIDVYPDRELVAGAPLHVAAHLAARGWATSLITRVGADADGRTITNVLERSGVDVSLVEVDANHPTGRVTIDMSGPDNRFVVARPVAWDFIEGPPALPPHDIFCYGTIAARSPRTRATLERLLANSEAAFKALDVNLRPPDVDARIVGTAIQAATVVKLNDQELMEVSAMLGIAPSPDAYFSTTKRLRYLCVTRGQGGAALYERAGERWSVPGRPVEIVDTVGAGDAFTAALVGALAEGFSGARALEEGQRCALSVLAQRGALPAGGAPILGPAHGMEMPARRDET